MKKLLIYFLIFSLLGTGCASGRQDTAPRAEPAASDEAAAVPAETAAETGASSAPASESSAPVFNFSAEDREGNIWTEACFAEHSITILNFWEPWCGPCVGEMPDLERIYQEYRDRDVLILGIYATADMEEDVQSVLEDTGVTYPILRYTADFDFLQTGYVPNTVFVNREGRILFQPYSGAIPYEKWVEVLEALV